MTTDTALATASELRQKGERWDAVLAQLRSDGYSKVEAIRVTSRVVGLSLSEAKRLVHYSPVWSDTQDADEHLQEDLLAELERDN